MRFIGNFGFSRQFTGRELRPVPDRIAQRSEPFERGIFDDGFVERHDLTGNSKALGEFNEMIIPPVLRETGLNIFPSGGLLSQVDS